MQRDRRLLAALLHFMVALVAGIIQAWIVNAYVRSAITGGWESFADFFGVDAPARGPKVCLLHRLLRTPAAFYGRLGGDRRFRRWPDHLGFCVVEAEGELVVVCP